jgi:hypothetical protein
MSTAKSSKTNSLIAAIQRKVPDSPASAHSPAPQIASAETRRRRSTRRVAAAAPKSRVGKATQFWFHDEDRRLVRELAAWLAGQGVRPTDSLVIRAALRTVKTGEQFLEACQDASQLDGRLKSHKIHESP